jgi:hypothetical protein
MVWEVWEASDTGGIPKKERGPALDIEERNLKLEAKRA